MYSSWWVSGWWWLVDVVWVEWCGLGETVEKALDSAYWWWDEAADDTLLNCVAVMEDSSVAAVATTDAVKLMMAVATVSNVSRRSSGSSRFGATGALPETSLVAGRTNGSRPVFTWGTPPCSWVMMMTAFWGWFGYLWVKWDSEWVRGDGREALWNWILVAGGFPCLFKSYVRCVGAKSKYVWLGFKTWDSHKSINLFYVLKVSLLWAIYILTNPNIEFVIRK